MKIPNNVFGFVHFHTLFFVHQIRHLLLSSARNEVCRVLGVCDVTKLKTNTNMISRLKNFDAIRAGRAHVEHEHVHTIAVTGYNELVDTAPQTLDAFYKNVKPYVELFNAFCKKHALVGNSLPDHLCYKCDSHETYTRMRSTLEAGCVYSYQSLISNRHITYLKLQKPIETMLGSIYFIELSDQKPDGSQVSKYDHIEVYSTAKSYEEFVSELQEAGNLVPHIRPHHSSHNIDIGNGFLFRTTQGPLIDKIKLEEMI